MERQGEEDDHMTIRPPAGDVVPISDRAPHLETIIMSKEAMKQKALRDKQILQDQAFWKQITKEMTEIDYQPEEFRSQTEIPNRPIRRIMCQEGNLGINKVMFTAESSMLFAKACEVFILDLTLRGWSNADADKRKKLTKRDIVKGCHQTDMYDFLVDILPPRYANDSSMRSQQPQTLVHSQTDSLYQSLAQPRIHYQHVQPFPSMSRSRNFPMEAYQQHTQQMHQVHSGDILSRSASSLIAEEEEEDTQQQYDEDDRPDVLKTGSGGAEDNIQRNDVNSSRLLALQAAAAQVLQFGSV